MDRYTITKELHNVNTIFPGKGDLMAQVFVWSYGLLLVQDFVKKVCKLLGFSCQSLSKLEF